jgi:integrase/recombinase XerD
MQWTEELTLDVSEETAKAYHRDVNNWLEWLPVKKLDKVTPQHITSYLAQEKQAGKSDASLNRYYMSIRSFCRYIRKTKAITDDLTQDIKAPRNNLKAPNVPSMTQVDRILAQPNVKTESGLRDRAILELLYSSGLRASELSDLTTRDIVGDSVIVRCGKRDKTRTVPLTTAARHWISKYMQKRGKDYGYLFLTLNRKQLRRQLLFAIVRDYANKAGVAQVSTHTMRHACATHLLDQGADIRLIQEVLGHSSIASTQRYTHLSSARVQTMFQQFHPRQHDDE